MTTWRQAFLPSSFEFVRLGGWTCRHSRISFPRLITKLARNRRRFALLGTTSPRMSSWNSSTRYSNAFPLPRLPTFSISIPIVFAYNVFPCRETFRLKQTSLSGNIVKPHPLQRGMPLIFGMSWPRPKRGRSRAFVHAPLRNTSPLLTLTMGMTSFTRYHFFRVLSAFRIFSIANSSRVLLISLFWLFQDWPTL